MLRYYNLWCVLEDELQLSLRLMMIELWSWNLEAWVRPVLSCHTNSASPHCNSGRVSGCSDVVANMHWL